MSSSLLQRSAPSFSLLDQDGRTHHVEDYRGQWVLLFFYPQDDTPGCTKEACGLRDAFAEYKEKKCTLLGVSADTVQSHKQFAEKYHLPFPLLADTEKTAIQRYGVWKEKKMMGKTYMGIARTSFLIDPEGKIAKMYEGVKPELHAAEVLRDLESLKV